MSPGGDRPAPEHVRRHSQRSLLLLIGLVVLAWAALAPIGAHERALALEIAKGAPAGSGALGSTGALPPTLRLTLGVRDVLHVKNHDTTPHYLGAMLIRPGKELRLPFEQTGIVEFTSSAHVGGKLTVLVEPWPDPGTARLRWRWREWVRDIRRY